MSNSSPKVCFYFQVHQPYRLRDLRITEIGKMKGQSYFDEAKNRGVFRKVAEKCYLPTNALILRLMRENPHFSVAYSLSGVFLDQCREYGQDVLDSFRALADTGRVEFLAETYYHSLSYLSSLEEFCQQVQKHAHAIEQLFGRRPTVFRNTELVYCNEIAEVTRNLGFRGILAEGADHVLWGATPNVPYAPPAFELPGASKYLIDRYRVHEEMPGEIRLLLKNYRLSDDIAFRFSNRTWVGYPLTADRFANWVRESGGHSINLFMDYETFGEHQWADTGIFDFLAALPSELRQSGVEAATPSEVIDLWGDTPTATLDVHTYVSWADIERDLSAWRGNHLQEASFRSVYALERAIKASGNPALLDTWRKLQTSDHFYYLCTKYWSDGDVHKYFSPYESPYEAYRRYSHALEDLRVTLENLPPPSPVEAVSSQRSAMSEARSSQLKAQS